MSSRANLSSRVLIALAVAALACVVRPLWAQQAIKFAVRFEDTSAPTSLSPGLTAESIPAPEVTECGLSLAEAESLALGQHPGLSAAYAQVRAARGRWLQVGLPPNPKAGYTSEGIGVNDTAGMQGGFVSQEFVTANKLGLNRAVAAQEVAQARWRASQVELDVITNVRTSYYQALVASRSLEIAGRVLEVSRQGEKTADQLLQAAEGTKVGLLQAHIQVESAEILRQQARNRKDAAWRSLAAAIGAPEMRPREVCGDLDDALPDFQWQATLDRILGESPELAELEQKIDRARWAVQRARAGRVPNVTVQATVQHEDMSDDVGAGLQVTIPLPIFDRNQGSEAAARAETSAARDAVLDKQLELQRRLAVVFERFQTSRNQVQRYKLSIVPSAAESLDLIQQAYSQGEVSYLDSLNAQRTYLQTNLEYLQSLDEFWANWAAIEGLVVNVPAP
jgi:cobalt-zinc-cadmium efflux system outer membrane protein